jgi:hypothetical protein
MHKLVFVPLLLVAGCVIAAVAGGVHNLIAYAVCPDFFEQWRFDEMELQPGKRGRTAAALTGAADAWWLGLTFGSPVLACGLTVPGRRRYALHSLLGLLVVAGTALLFGVSALLVALGTVTDSSLHGPWIPPGVSNRVGFAAVTAMRDFATIGGVAGLLVAGLYLLAVGRLRRRRAGRHVSRR